MNKTKHEKHENNAAANAVVEPKRYEEAFKRQAVEHWLRSGRNGAQIARELGMSYPSLKEWKRRYGGDAAPQRADLEAENRALRTELGRVREQRDILKKTLGILSEVPRLVTSVSKP
jgi:transposase